MHHYNRWTPLDIWICVIIVILTLVAYVIFLITRRGKVQVNRSLITEENLNLIVRNWRKLIDSGMFHEELPDSGYPGDHVLLSGTADDFFDEENPFYGLCVRIYPYPRTGKRFSEVQIAQATFERDAPMEGGPTPRHPHATPSEVMGMVLHLREYFGSCRTNILVVSPQCEIEFFARVRKPNSGCFDAILAKMLETVQS